MHRCQHCGEPWRGSGGPQPKDACPRCGSHLHTCLHCAYLDAVRRYCLHPMADQPGDLSRANDCLMFALADGRDLPAPAGPGGSPPAANGAQAPHRPPSCPTPSPAWQALWTDGPP